MKAKKNDLILIGIVLIIAAVFFLGYRLTVGKGDGGTVLITMASKEYACLNLDEDGTYIIKANQQLKKIDSNNMPEAPYNVLTIKEKTVYMTEASCPDLLCVHQAKISKTGEQIVCLPNKVVVEIINGKSNDVDVVAT